MLVWPQAGPAAEPSFNNFFADLAAPPDGDPAGPGASELAEVFAGNVAIPVRQRHGGRSALGFISIRARTSFFSS